MNPIQQGRAAVEKQGAGFSGKLNAYECDGEGAKLGCGSNIITIDRDVGVTPFMMKCGNCGAYGHSKMYRVSPELVPTHEWYRPETMDGVNPAYADHISHGGLILRPIDGQPDVWIDPRAEIKTLLDQRRAAFAAAEAAGKLDINAQSELMTKQPVAATSGSRQQRRREARKLRR